MTQPTHTRLFIWEYAVDTGLAPELAVEGRAMKEAVVADFSGLPEVEVVSMAPATDAPMAFRQAAAQADWSLVIAPETGGILECRARWVQESGGRLLGCSPDAIALCGDKWALAQHWQSAGIPTPPCWLMDGNRGGSSVPFAKPWIVKPRIGAGSEDVWQIRPGQDFPLTSGMMVQPLAAGRSASVALLVGPNYALPLRPAAQHLSNDGRYRYLGGGLPLPAGLSYRAITLASRAVAAVPGLLGYVGVDLVLGDADDGQEDVAIEINPRLTTSYIGLRRLTASNLAAAMLRAVQGKPIGVIEWRNGGVRWEVTGETVRVIGGS